MRHKYLSLIQAIEISIRNADGSIERCVGRMWECLDKNSHAFQEKWNVEILPYSIWFIKILSISSSCTNSWNFGVSPSINFCADLIRSAIYHYKKIILKIYKNQKLKNLLDIYNCRLYILSKKKWLACSFSSAGTQDT